MERIFNNTREDMENLNALLVIAEIYADLQPVKFYCVVHRIALLMESSDQFRTVSHEELQFLANHIMGFNSTSDAVKFSVFNSVDKDVTKRKKEDFQSDNSNLFTCRICFSNNVSVVGVKCGHLVCTHCYTNLKTKELKCPFCREIFVPCQMFYS